MCGIFSFLQTDNFLGNPKRDVESLIQSSAKRGRDAFGICIVSESHFYSYKIPKDPLLVVRDNIFWNDFIDNYNKSKEGSSFILVLGQCRLATSGSSIILSENQPLITQVSVGVHNGIFIEGKGNIDFTKNDSWYAIENLSTVESSEDFFKSFEGEASIISYRRDEEKLLWCTNNGSLYHCNDEKKEILCSEPVDGLQVKQVTKNTIFYKNLGRSKELSTPQNWRKKLKRCSKCILPESHPHIYFDKAGICNFCNNYKIQKFRGKDELLRKLDKYRSKNGEPDCIVGLSGGRDSCYGLHVLKNELGMNPIAFTYDWGLTTDISRRNQSLICGKLGVEHIVRSADLERKRRYIRKNVDAWLKNPHLGMVPLFMAGDKEFYEYGRVLQKERNIPLTILCSGQQVEQREFMVGFTGIKQPDLRNNPDMYHHPISVKIKLALWYASQYLKNPRYINESFWDSIYSYFISFVKSTNFIYLFHYIHWDESQIEETLKNEYGWQSDDNFGTNQWRMGDGQTAFTNFIYYQLAGITEFDSYRSHQIREGYLRREDALLMIEKEVEPRFENIKEFCEIVGLSYEETMKKIVSMRL